MKIIGLFGHPVAHTLSPVMHNAALGALGLEKHFVYLAFDILPVNLKEALNALKIFQVRGVNVTIPHKERVIPYLDKLDPEAEQMQAVNVILHNERGKLVGYNTDGRGFIRSLKEEAGVGPSGKKILILGAGGAAKAVAFSLISQGAGEITIVNRTREKALALGKALDSQGNRVFTYDFSPKFNQNLQKAICSADIIINTTSVGLYPPDQSLLTDFLEHLQPGQLVVDLIYHPAKTLLLKQAEAKGCQTLSGLGMLVYQGAEAFELWTGHPAPVSIMREALIKELEKNDFD